MSSALLFPGMLAEVLVVEAVVAPAVPEEWM